MNQFFYSLVKGKVALFGQVAIGATGAPTLSAVNSKGIASISRTGTGAYTITLQDKYVGLFGFVPTIIQASGTQTVANVYVVSETVSSTKTINIACLDFAGSAVDPANGAVIKFEVTLSNSTAQ
jgi:hypothetical protein